MTPRLLTAVVVLVAFCAAPAAVLAKGKPEEQGCKEKIEIPGYPHTLTTIAEINAIRNWTEAAIQHGEDFAQWHFARSTKIECKTIGKEGLFQCHAAGKPCKTSTGTTARAADAK